MDKVFTLSFFWLFYLPLHTSSKHKGLFDCFTSVNKKLPFAVFCGIPFKVGKMFKKSYIFINFVLFSSGKTKFSMASCLEYFQWKKTSISICFVKAFIVVFKNWYIVSYFTLKNFFEMYIQGTSSKKWSLELSKWLKLGVKSQKMAEIPGTVPFIYYPGRRV